MAYNILSGTIIGPDELIAKSDGTFTHITASVSGTFINASGTAVSFSTIGTIGGSGGSIGAAEDGNYNDGLFTDFTTGTLIGIPIDRFNELFKSLVPPPAPNVSRLFSGLDGTDAHLSFGASNNMESDSTPYFSVGTAAGFAAKDTGDLYETETSGTNFRLAIFRGNQNITGIVNDHVTASVLGSFTNYTANAYGNSDTGSLQLYINSTSTASHTLNLATATGTGNPGAGTSSSLNSSGSGFTNISIAKSATDANNNTFDIFKHRTTQYLIHSSSQRMGWNYAFVKHIVGAATYTTNYIEWVNDNNAVSPTVTSNSIHNVSLLGTRFLSGVKYNLSASANYSFLVSNFYKNVYTRTMVSCTDNQGLVDITDVLMPHIKKEDENKTVAHTRSVSTTATKILNTSFGATASVTHVFKGTATGKTSISGFLIYTPTSNNPSNTVEYFRNELYRLPSASYDAQVDVTTGSWTSATHMTGSGTHADGLLIYNEALRSPKNGANGGNFSTIANTESGNPNYSGVSGTRTFYRAFKNVGAAVNNVSIAINGAGTIVTSGGSLGANSNLKVFVKTPAKTGWMSMADAFTYNNVSDGQGARDPGVALQTNLASNATNVVTLGTKSVATGEWFLIKVEADANWTGNINQISVVFGAGSGGKVNPSNLSKVAETVSSNGASARLSFGASKAITGYTSAANSPTINSAVDVNGQWIPNTGLTNQRLGVYNKTIDITGDLNSGISSGRLTDGDSGSLKLYINGVERHSIDLTSFGSGNSLNSSGSGFNNVSARLFPTHGNGVHDYTKPYRTGEIKVDTNDQTDGWNFLRVVHTSSGGFNRTTNYIEWINDSATGNITVAGGNITNFGSSGATYYSSGIKFFATAPTATFTLTSSNNYINVCDNDGTDAIDFDDSLTNVTITQMTASGDGITTLNTSDGTSAYPLLLTSPTDTQTGSINHKLTLRFSPAKSLMGSFVDSFNKHTASIGSAKFLEPPFNNSGNSYSTFTTSDFTSFSKSKFLRFSGSETSTNQNGSEHFTGEGYRLQNKNVTYSQQSHISGGSGFTYAWNSEYSVNDSGSYANYCDGLVVFDGKLIAPPKAGVNGDCRNTADGGSLQAPASNVNYSIGELQVGTRTYVRYFKNTTGSDKTNIQVTLYGSGILDDLGTGYAGSNFKLEYKFPSSDSSVSTGWLDAGKNSQSGNKDVDGEGGATGVGGGYFPLTINTGGTTIAASPNYLTLLGGAWENNKYLLIRVRASASWSGHIERIEVS